MKNSKKEMRAVRRNEIVENDKIMKEARDNKGGGFERQYER
jgi:hypothetical protein